MKIEIEERETGSRIALSFYAKCNDEVCGMLTAHKTTRGRRAFYTVDDVRVNERFRRSGVATRLYEAAHAEACRRRSRLGSSERLPDAHSHDFWAKQFAKGRADVVWRPPAHHPAFEHENRRYAAFVLKDCPKKGQRADLSGAGWSAKRERQYEHIKESCLARDGRKTRECKRIAAATVNKTRAAKCETKSCRRK